jgi:polyhydroxybutyrate depolymerase
MSYVLACELSNEIAAIASVTGSMSPPTANSCSPTHPTPVLQIHGTNDPTVPYEGAIFSENIDDVMAYWVDYNNCNPTPSQTPIPDINTGDGTTVDHFVFDGGTNGANVELFKVYNGEHDWPGAFGNYDISSNVEIWKFFSRYDINGTLSVSDNKEQVNYSLSPNPVQDILTINRSFGTTSKYEIFTLEGKKVLSGQLKGLTQKLDINALPRGAYLFVSGISSKKFMVQ